MDGCFPLSPLFLCSCISSPVAQEPALLQHISPATCSQCLHFPTQDSQGGCTIFSYQFGGLFLGTVYGQTPHPWP